MDDAPAVDELGPVDYIVVELPDSKFNGVIAPALAELVEQGTIRVLDLLVLKKGCRRGGGAVVSDDYEPHGNAFTGTVNWVQIDIDAAATATDHLITPEERIRVAMARQ